MKIIIGTSFTVLKTDIFRSESGYIILIVPYPNIKNKEKQFTKIIEKNATDLIADIEEFIAKCLNFY